MIADHIGTDGMDTTAAVDDCNGLLDVIVSLCSLAAKKVDALVIRNCYRLDACFYYKF